MRKWLVLASVLSMFFLLFTAQNSSAADFSFDNIKFFESGYDITSHGQRVYKTEFPKSTTRYICYELNLANHLYNVRNHSHSIVVKYYNPNGTLRGELKSNFTIESGWSTAWQAYGWGWSNPGNWPVGTCTVKVWIDNVFITSSYFTIYDDVVHLRFEGLKFFESGYNEYPPADQTMYRSSFSRRTSRYINVLVMAENLLYGVRDHNPLIKARFYNPDGSFRGETSTDKTVPSNWEKVDTWLGWGWKEPGHWPTGTYRVEIYFGDKYLTQGYFTITQ